MDGAGLEPLKVDLAIVGAGPVGSLLALALQGSGLRVALFEASEASLTRASYDGRTLALSYASRVFLESLSLWQAVESTAEPIRQVHVSQQGFLGSTRLDAHSVNTPALGYVIPAAQLGQYIDASLASAEIKIYHAHRLTAVSQVHTRPEMVFETPDGSMQCQARWLVGADGAQSTVRRLLGLNQGEKEYGQTAVLAKIKLSKPHQGVAYERFTTQGPIALLPLPDDWASLVWTHPHADVEAVLDWPEATFLAQVQHAFGYRAGVFLASSHRWAYPLKLVHSPTILQGKGLLIGNAAHALHPVSGQGLNLGIEDIARVVEFIEHYAVLDPALEDLPLLAERLQRHHQKLVRSTDGLVRVFGLQGQWAGHLRALGLMGLDALSPLRDRFTRDAMGLIAPLARMKQGYAPFSSERLHK